MNKVISMASSSSIIKKSTFIGFVYPCGSKDECKEIVSSLWLLHPKATHICVAFVGEHHDDVWFDDDGEPAHSAGKVMLNVLLKQNLVKSAAFVIRYYGGIQLGVGGLVKAYTSSVSETLKVANIIPITKTPVVTFKLCFEHAFPLWETLKRKKIGCHVQVNETDCSFKIDSSLDDLNPYLVMISSQCLSEVEENWIEV
jgi:uncharacterized YigZ family protein